MHKIRMGMVGGGEGAFIGAIHRMAAALDGQIELVCGAFNSTAQASLQSGIALGLPEWRSYTNYQEMFEREATLSLKERMDFVAIVTPNYLHFPIAKMALESGFHVMSDKPATMNLQEAYELEKIVNKSDCLYALSHTYNGYPMVKEARQRIMQGELGQIRKVLVEYSQGWLANKADENSKQAKWRLDPELSGVSCCMGDIGVHAANLAEYVCRDQISEICADLHTTVDGRFLDDDGNVLLKFFSGAYGVLIASQVSIGEENNLTLRVYGDKASLQWSQQEANTLWLKYPNQSTQMLRTGVGNLSTLSMANTRTPAGHPEGYIEAFANLYRNFAEQIRARKNKQHCDEISSDLPGIEEAIRGMAFIENVVASSQSDKKWHPMSLAYNYNTEG